MAQGHRAFDTADFSVHAAGEDRTDTGDGGQLSDDGIGLDLGGDPSIDLLDLSFQEADVVQGEVEDTPKAREQGLV